MNMMSSDTFLPFYSVIPGTIISDYAPFPVIWLQFAVFSALVKRIAGAHRTEYLKQQAVEAKLGGWNCALEYRGKGI